MNSLLLQANALHIPLGDKSVHAIVTSPPYFRQRDYETAYWTGGDINCNHDAARHANRFDYTVSDKQLSSSGSAFSEWEKVCPTCGAVRDDAQLGQEETHDCLGWATGDDCGECYICHMRSAARECYRVLRDDGTFWLNIGDSHNGSGGAGGDYNAHGFRAGQKRYSGARMVGVKPKSQLMIPARLAMALEQDGWYLRVGIPWIKRNAYVEGVFDRPTTKIEYIYMLTKSRHYFYDHIAVLKEYKGEMNRWGGEWLMPKGQLPAAKQESERGNPDGRNARPSDWFFDSCRAILNGEDMLMLGEDYEPLALVVNTESSGIPHYATFPPSLVRPLISASTSEHGVCAECGAPLERIIEKDGATQQRHQKNNSETPYRDGNMVNLYRTTGWGKTCSCATEETKAATVFDPFAGSGTTLVVASQLGRRGVGCDLSTEYLRAAQKRVAAEELPLLVLLEQERRS